MNTLLLCFFFISTVFATDPYIWPAPQSVTSGSTTLSLDPDFVFYTSSSSSVLARAITRYTNLIFIHEPWEAASKRGYIPLPQLTM